jgi:hypothetical protein
LTWSTQTLFVQLADGGELIVVGEFDVNGGGLIIVRVVVGRLDVNDGGLIIVRDLDEL